MLTTPPSDVTWYNHLGLGKASCVELLMIGAADGYRRLVLPYMCQPWQLLGVSTSTAASALASMEAQCRQHSNCHECSDPLFSKVFLDWALGPSLSHEHKLERVAHVQMVLRDVLGQLPLSSIDVERSHANIQVDMNASKAVPKRPSNAQCDSYICCVSLEHEHTKKQVELETLGIKQDRVKKTMRARKVETSAPGNGLSLRRSGFNSDGTVKGRDGLLKGLLSVKAGGVRRTRPETRRVSGFNAFQKANKHLFKRSRLASAENRQESKKLAELWRDLPADARERYEEQAREIQAARDELKAKVLSKTASAAEEAAEIGVLSTAQVKRLNGCRLDQTLGQVSGHPVWKAGLGLSDHVAALKATLVMSVPDATAMRGIKRQHDEAFSYDPTIVPNPQLPKFIRPCCMLHGGTCQCDPHFDLMQRFVKQFHEQLIAERLGGSPTLVELKPGQDETSIWLIVATVALRPQCHIVIYLHSAAGFLHLTMQNGSLAMGTMHRVMRRMLQAASRGDTPLDDFRCTVRLYGGPEMDDSEDMRFLQPDEDEALLEHELGGNGGLGPRRVAVAPAGGCRLPFGLVPIRTRLELQLVFDCPDHLHWYAYGVPLAPSFLHSSLSTVLCRTAGLRGQRKRARPRARARARNTKIPNLDRRRRQRRYSRSGEASRLSYIVPNSSIRIYNLFFII
ncbi:unnamed protein product [Symbiodinium sp. CCMP2592]|nr:unnamed protein product [Symbiodinium sp. CCMP2592]